VERRMKKTMIVSLALFLLVTACAQDLAPLREQEKVNKVNDIQVEKVEPVNDVAEGAIKTGKEQEKKQQTREAKEKLTETKCKEAWKPLADITTPLLKMEEGKIIVIFKSGVTYQDAINVLKEYDAEFEEAVEIFPLGKETTNEDRYNNYRRIKASVDEGKEIQIACKILQDESVEESSLSVITDFASLARAAQQ